MLCLIPADNNHARYGATFLIVTGILSGITLSVGNITSNCCGDIKKAIAVGLFQAFGSTMGVATGYLFPQNQGPAYKIGFWVLFGTSAFTGVGSAFMTYMTIRENKRRDRLYGPPPTNVVIDFDEDGLMEQHPHWRYYK